MYRQAGTLASAISGITEQAKQEEQASASTLRTKEAASLNDRARLNRRPLNSTPTSRSIPAYIQAGATEEDKRARNASAIACFDQASVANKPSSFTDFLLNQGDHQELARAITRCLGI